MAKATIDLNYLIDVGCVEDLVSIAVAERSAATKEACIAALRIEMDKMKDCTAINSPFYVFGVARIAKCIEAIEGVELEKYIVDQSK